MQFFCAVLMCANVLFLGTPHQLAFALPANIQTLTDQLVMKSKNSAEDNLLNYDQYWWIPKFIIMQTIEPA